MKRIDFHFNTIYSRILFFNLLLVVFVTVVPFTVFTNYVISSYNSQINQYNLQLARQTQNYIDDTVIEKIVDMPNTYFSELDSNYELTYPYYNDISNDSVMIEEINTRLKNISSTYSFIGGINIFYTKSNIMFGTSGVKFVGDESFLKTIQEHEQIVNVLENIDKPTEWLSSVKMLDNEELSSAVFVKVLPYSTSIENKKAVLAIGFDTNFFYQFIEKIHFNKDETLLILDPDGNIILSTDKKQNGTHLQDEKLLKDIMEKQESGMLNDKIFGKNSVISFSKSKCNDWRYISVTSIESYYQKSTQMKMIILFSLLLLLPIEFMLSAFSTKTAYKPFSKVLGYIKGIVVNGAEASENEYRLLENTFKGLNEKVYELNSRLEENKPIIRQNFLLKLLKGSEGENPHAEQELVNISFKGERVFCIMLRLFCSEEMSLENRLIIIFNLQPLIESLPDIDIKTVVDESNRLTVIINFNEDMDSEMILDTLSKAIGSTLNLSFTICAGNVYGFFPGSIHKSYVEASETYRYAFVSCNERIIRIDNVNTQKNRTCSQPKNINKFEEILKAGDEEAAHIFIAFVVSELRQGCYGIETVRNTLMDMVTVVRMTLIDLGLDENELFGGNIRNAYERLESICNFETWMKAVCTHITGQLNTRRELIGKDLELKIRQYITNNLYNNISLENVADSLYLSSGYLSKIFKTVFGTNFTEYVVNLKMEEAVKLLAQNTLTVKQISNALGYSSVQYFIRIFKEKYGYTPKFYQKTQMNGENPIE